MGRKTTKEKAMEKRKEKEDKAGEIESNWGKKKHDPYPKEQCSLKGDIIFHSATSLLTYFLLQLILMGLSNLFLMKVICMLSTMAETSTLMNKK